MDLDSDEDVPDQKSGSEGEYSLEEDEDDLDDQSDDDSWEDESGGKGDEERNVLDGLALPHSSANEISKFLPYIMKHKPADHNEDMMGQYHKFLQGEASKGEMSCFGINYTFC